MNMTDWNQLSILEAAETLLLENKQPMSFLELLQAISEVKKLTEEEKNDITSQVYADFIVSAKFVYVGDDLWDLKSRQSIDLWDKDGAYYDEFPDYKEDEPEEFDDDEEEDEEEETEEFDSEKDEDEEDEDEYEFEEEEDELEADEFEDDIDYDDFDDVEDEYLEDETDLPVEDETDFDDDKYNEYMDDYEKMYDE
jgi:DNA-directed RNA polymerase subunit delta